MGRKDTLLSVKKIISVFLVLSMLLALTACVRYSVGCTVNSDGTVNLTYLYALSDLTDGNGDSGWAEEKKEFESKGWSTRDYTGDGSSESSSYNGFIASKGGIPIDQVETEVRALGRSPRTQGLRPRPMMPPCDSGGRGGAPPHPRGRSSRRHSGPRTAGSAQGWSRCPHRVSRTRGTACSGGTSGLWWGGWAVSHPALPPPWGDSRAGPGPLGHSRQSWGPRQSRGSPPAWAHWREYSARVWQRQLVRLTRLQWQRSCRQASR